MESTNFFRLLSLARSADSSRRVSERRVCCTYVRCLEALDDFICDDLLLAAIVPGEDEPGAKSNAWAHNRSHYTPYRTNLALCMTKVRIQGSQAWQTSLVPWRHPLRQAQVMHTHEGEAAILELQTAIAAHALKFSEAAAPTNLAVTNLAILLAIDNVYRGCHGALF